MSEYPNLKAALQTQLNEAQTIFEAAQNIGEEESRIAQLAAANKMAAPSYVNQLDNFDRKTENLRKTAIKLFDNNDEQSLLIAGIKNMNVESTIQEAKSYLQKVEAKNQYQAEQVVDKAMGKLERMEKEIKDGLRKIERKKKELETSPQ